FCSVVPAQPVPGSSTGSGNLDFLCSKNSTRASPWPLQSFRVQSFMDARQAENRYRHSRSQDYASCGKSPEGLSSDRTTSRHGQLGIPPYQVPEDLDLDSAAVCNNQLRTNPAPTPTHSHAYRTSPTHLA